MLLLFFVFFSVLECFFYPPGIRNIRLLNIIFFFNIRRLWGWTRRLLAFLLACGWNRNLLRLDIQLLSFLMFLRVYRKTSHFYFLLRKKGGQFIITTTLWVCYSFIETQSTDKKRSKNHVTVKE